MSIDSFKWDEFNPGKSLVTRKMYFKGGDSLRVYEYIDDSSPNRFKVISRLDNYLREFPHLTEHMAEEYCNLIMEEERDSERRNPLKNISISEEVDAFSYAKYIINFCNQQKTPITNFRLQRALYELQKAWIKETGEELFYDSMEAWSFGPCIPTIYYYYCGNGGMPIFGTYDNYIAPSFIVNNNKLRPLIKDIATKCSSLAPWDIQNSKAWKKVRDESGDKGTIDIDMIKLEIEGKI